MSGAPVAKVVLGIDPGLERIGFGVVTKTGSRLSPGEFGLILTPRLPIAQRLRQIHEEVADLIMRVQPTDVALERLFFAKNQTTALDVAKAIGVILLACESHGITTCEYAPPEVKRAVVGNGNADKNQVQYMVTKLLGLDAPPRPDDVADALAIAITHALRGNLQK